MFCDIRQVEACCWPELSCDVTYEVDGGHNDHGVDRGKLRAGRAPVLELDADHGGEPGDDLRVG